MAINPARKAVIAGSIVAAWLILAGCLLTEGKDEPSAQEAAVDPLIDSLADVYRGARRAALAHDRAAFFELLDSAKAASLSKTARKYGYDAVDSYIAHRVSSWPELDTLEFHESKDCENYVRLTYHGPVQTFGFQDARVMYTFLLFKRYGNHWRLTAMSSLQKDQYGLYGYELSYHETDLPPQLRFPRKF
jgi:hypothetical protein